MQNGSGWTPVSSDIHLKGAANAANRRPFSLRLAALIVGSIALLLAMSGLATRSLQAQRIETGWVIHTQQVRYELARVLQLLIDDQTGSLGFALTGSQRALQAYREATPLIKPAIGQLKELISDNPRQRPLAARLEGLADDLQSSSATLVKAAQSSDAAAVRSLIDAGHVDDVMPSARALLLQMQAEEDRLMTLRRDAEDRARRDAALALWATGGLGAALLLLIVYFARRDEANLLRAERELAMTLRSIGTELQIINEYARFPVAHCDSRHHFIFVNKAYAERLGLRPQDCAGKHIPEVVGERAYQSVRPYIEEALAGRAVEFETEVPYDGAYGSRWMHCIYAPVRDEDGKIGSFVAAVTDITARMSAEEELRRSKEALQETDRRKDEFIATLSHELRNPLAPIRTAAKILASPQLAPAHLQRAQTIIERQVTHMALLLDDLLDIARITQGKLQLKREPIPLIEVVDAAVEAARPMIDGKNHRLTVSLPASPITLEADPLRLSQILSNLLTNAAKYSDPGSHIEVVGSVEHDILKLAVNDDGIGIAAESIARIFDMFSQIEGVRGRSDGGLGIGLALVKGLTELHGGTVEARSRGLGHGSEFIVRLPLSTPYAVRSTLAADPAPVPTRSRILVADDNRDAADSLSMLLELAGHEVRVAHSGRSALSLAQAFRPDFALLDIGMPDLSGYEVAEQLRREPWGQEIQLIALTGWGQEKDRQRALQAGFNHHLTKPIDPDRLEALISGHRRQPPSAF
jgi:PAS domain S-box-containing protein